MPLLTVVVGATSVLVPFFIQDTTKTTGLGLAGLLYDSPGLQASYHREGIASRVSIVLVTMTLPTWVSGGFVEDNASLAKGQYWLGVPNAAFVAGAKWVDVRLEGAVNMAPVPILIELAPGIAAAVVVRG
jgi:hypothetical protein